MAPKKKRCQQARARVPRTHSSSQSQRDAGSHLLSLLLRLYSSAKLSAFDFCLACHWADKAGAPGAAFDLYAVPPGQQSGKYQRHLDNVLPDVKHLTTVATPCNRNRGAARSIRHIIVRCIYESVEDELACDPTLHSMLDDPDDAVGCETVMSLPVYKNHPMVIEAARDGRPRPLPLAFYLDGVQFRSPAAGRTDSVLGFWAINLLSKKRHLISVLRNSDYCSCGCKGWCSLYPQLQAAQWMFEGMSNGKRPPRTWDDKPWDPSSPVGTAAKERPDLSYRAALIYIKGDWSEHAHSLGLASWSSAWSPCQFCTLAKFELHSLYHDMRDGMQWQLRSNLMFEQACRKCEIRVTLLTQADRITLLRSLRWRKATKPVPIGGRIMVDDVNIGGVQVLAGDRLEPSTELPDTCALERSPVPINIILWRTHRDPQHRAIDCVSHRCPMFDPCIGTTPQDNLAVDELHCLYFGPIMRYISACMWRVVLANIWQFVGTIDQVVELATRQVSAELMSWMDDNNVPHNRRLSGITPKMLGKRMGYTTRDARD